MMHTFKGSGKGFLRAGFHHVKLCSILGGVVLEVVGVIARHGV